MPRRNHVCLGLLGVVLAFATFAEERTERFDKDPGWDGLNNRPDASTLRTVTQDFGYSATERVGDAPDAIGGTISPDGRPAYYAKVIQAHSFDDTFSASGTIAVPKGAGNTLLGFFNHDTVNEWRTPNSVVMRINGRGDVFHVHLEYCTRQWRAGAGIIGRYDREADRMYPVEIPSGGVHTWSIEYDPNGNGVARLTFDAYTATAELAKEHRADGAAFDRFGLLNVVKSVDSPGVLWIGGLRIDGRDESLASDPRWDGLNNRNTYLSAEVRPRFDFGYSATSFCGGATPGEIGGLFFRGDCRYANKLAYYGARLSPLDLNSALHARGTIAFRRGVSDSTTLFGFFHSQRSVEVNPSQRSAMPRDFLGLAVEGPSSEGFFVYPCYRSDGDEEGNAAGSRPPHIYPDGARHEWTLDYDPQTGLLSASLDGIRVELPIAEAARTTGMEFDRFGFVTPWIDGNGQRVYLDDITYTCK